MSSCRPTVRSLILLCAAALFIVACEKKESAPPPSATPAAQAGLPADLILATAPAGAKPVEDLKGKAKVGETVAIQGRVGGSADPFVENRAVLTIVGPGIPACSDNPGDMCEVPWDYCCETAEDIAAHSATVQVVDASGALLKAGLSGVGGIRGLSDLIVVGRVAQSDDKVLVVHATGIYIAKK
jgi:hypothetical protein